MADKETGLNIPIGAYADEKSVRDATKKIYRELEGSLKDGRIEIPIELKAPIKGASNELVEAQKDVIKKLESASKKGFSSSSKESNDFLDSYVRFKKLVGQSHKNNQTQVKDLDAIIGKVAQLIKLEKNLKRVEQTTTTESVKTTRSTRTKRQPMTAEEKRRLKQEEKESVDYAINNQNGINKFVRKLSKSSTGNRTPIGDIRLGYREPTLGKSDLVTEESIKNSRSSPYQNYWGQMNKSLQRDNAELAKKIKSYKLNPEELFNKNKEIDAEITPKKKERAETQNRMALDSALLNSVKSTLNKIIGDNPKVTTDALSKIIDANVARGREKGESPDITANKIANKILSVFYPKGDAIGSTDGTSKADALNVEKINKLIKETIQRLGEEGEKALKEFTAEAEKLGVESSYTSKTKEKNSALNKEVTRLNSKTEKAYVQSVRESSREGTADQAEARTSRSALNIASETLDVTREDAGDGLNAETTARELIDATKSNFDILEQIRDILKQVTGGGNGAKTVLEDKIDNQKHDYPSPYVMKDGKLQQTSVIDKTDYTKKRIKLPDQSQYDNAQNKRKNTINDPAVVASIEKELQQINEGTHESQQRRFVEQSEVTASQKGFIGALRKVFKEFTPETEVDRIMSANAAEQERMRAERIEKYGLNRGRDLTDTGDIADVKRTKSLFGWIYKNDERNRALFQDVKLTPGFTGKDSIDTTKIMLSLNKVLSGSEMFKAQTGGTLRNILGSFTGYLGMPSLEKSRAQAEGLNQVMANVRGEVLSLIQDVQAKEATLIGMEKIGTARFDKEGNITDDSSLAAKNTFTKLEEQKQVLKSVLAEVEMIDQVVDKSDGKVSKIIKNLGFVMPELMRNNTIIQNINAGLDKNGKALKFQSRTAEILNYTFQLMSRHIGQMIKNWIMMINPISLINRAFQDFASYDVKWQRTLNVIKYNLRDIIRPFMEWIAQKLVDIIGFIDIISMKIQQAFGYTPVSLFDQKNADEFKKTYEEINSISAGFDELHDVGTSSENDPDNLLGEIYKPQLSQEWIDLANEIGDLFAGIITGDLGFGEVMLKILKIAWDGLKIIGGYVWDFMKNTVWPAIKDNWLEILAWVLGAFIAWKGLKTIGSLLWGAFTGGLKGIANWISQALFGKTLFSSATTAGTTVGSLFGKALYTSASGTVVTLGKFLGGTALAATGTIGALTLSKSAGENWQDLSTGMKAVSVVGTGLLSGMAGLGAVMLGASGPAGWAIAGTVALASLTLGMAQTQDGIASLEEETEKLAQTQANAQTANDNYQLSLDNLATTTSNLEQLEKQTGLTGKELEEQVKSGALSVDTMTSAQLQVYTAYLKNEEMIKQLKEATEQKTEADKENVLQSLRVEAANAIEADSYTNLRDKVVQAWQDGSISAQEAGDILSRTLANADDETQRTFGESIPEEIRSAFNPDQYESGWRKFGESFKSAMKSIGNWFTDTWSSIKSWWSGLWNKNSLPDGSGGSFSTGNGSGAGGGGAGGRSLLIGSFAVGTNYVPNDGLAYLHQGEAVIPKKYNQPYQPAGMSPQEQAYMQQMMNTMRSLDNTMKQGISVNGQFVQRGSDLVAVVNKTKSQTGADLLSNVSYAR